MYVLCLFHDPLKIPLLSVLQVFVFPDRPPESMKYDLILDCVRPAQISNTSDRSALPRMTDFSPLIPEWMDYLRPVGASRYVSMNPPLLHCTDRWGPFLGTGAAVGQLLASNFFTLSSRSSGIGSGCGWKQLHWAFFRASGRRLERLMNWLSRGEIRTFVDTVYPFDKVPDAFERMQKRGVRGKIVIQLDSE